MARYGDINRADELVAAKRKLETWSKLSKADKRTAYTASKLGGRTDIGRTTGFIKPFGTDTNFWYRTRVLALPNDTKLPTEDTETALLNSIINAIVGATGKNASTAIPTGTNLVIKQARRIEFAKVRVSLKGTQSRPTISRITGNPYTQKEVRSASCAFGMLADGTIGEAATINTLRTAILLALPEATVTFTAQGFVG